MSQTRRPRPVKAATASPSPAPEPTQGTEQNNQKVRNISQSSLIDALQQLLGEKDQRIQELESRVVMLNAVISSQDAELDALKNPPEEEATTP